MPVTKTPYLSVIIPCYNEMANLERGVLDHVVEYFDKKKFSYEIIIAEDGSTDESRAFVDDFSKKHPQVRILHNKHIGKAGGVTKGMIESTGEVAMFTDMDQATPIEEFDKLIPFLSQGYDVVVGSRSGERKGAPLTRQILAKGMVILRTIIAGFKGVSDTQCGFKMFSREAAKALFPQMSALHDGYNPVSGANVSAGFDVELLFLAQHRGYKIKEVPVIWHHVETHRVNFVKDAIDSVMYLMRIRLNQLRGIYK